MPSLTIYMASWWICSENPKRETSQNHFCFYANCCTCPSFFEKKPKQNIVNLKYYGIISTLCSFKTSIGLSCVWHCEEGISAKIFKWGGISEQPLKYRDVTQLQHYNTYHQASTAIPFGIILPKISVHVLPWTPGFTTLRVIGCFEGRVAFRSNSHLRS